MKTRASQPLLSQKSESPSIKLSNVSLGLHLLFFLASGVFTPIIIQLLRYNGACDKKTFFYLYPNYIAMSFMYFVPSKVKRAREIVWMPVIASILVDVVAQGMVYYGMVLSGAMIYTTVYSSVTVWSALLSRVILKKKLTVLQWLSCFLVTIGIAFSATDAKSSGSFAFLGASICLLGSILHALIYVMIEYNITDPKHALAPEQICSFMGFGGVFCYTIYICIFVIPNFEVLVLDSISSNNGDLTDIGVLYGLLFVAFFIHAYTFYNMLGSVGSVVAGILKGVNACCVFIMAQLLLCNGDPERQNQCFTSYKGIALGFVTIGVFIYSYSKNKQTHSKETSEL